MSFKPTSEIIVRADYTLSSNPNNKRLKQHMAANGEMLVSKQELHIYNFCWNSKVYTSNTKLHFQGLTKHCTRILLS